MLVWVKGNEGYVFAHDAEGVKLELSNGMVIRVADFEGEALVVTCPTGALTIRPSAANQVVLEQLE